VNNNYNILIKKLDAFIRKYYKNKLLKGGIYSVGLLLLSFLVFTSLEYFGEFNITGRTVLFYSFCLLSIYVVGNFIVLPLLKLYRLGSVINHKQAAEIIGHHFDEVKDKLTNVLQLQNIAQSENNQLLLASIEQKAVELSPVPFSNAVQLDENKKHLKYALFPLLVVLAIGMFSPKIFTEGTERLVNHNVYFEPVAPFKMLISNNNLEALKNKDFILNVTVSGNQLPNKIYIQKEGTKFPLSKTDGRNYTYTFKNMQKEVSFKLYGSGFYSQKHTVKVLPNPFLIGFKTKLSYPKYLNKEPEVVENTGDLILPEGTKVKWTIKTEDAEVLYFAINDSSYKLKPKEQKAVFRQTLKNNSIYSFVPTNQFVSKGDTSQYSIQVIADKYPSIEVEEKTDSLNSNRIYFNGLITDDYGFKTLSFNYKILSDKNPKQENIQIPFNPTINQEEFFFFWNLEKLNILPGDEIEYYFVVGDNDGVNGIKRSQTALKTLRTKTLNELNKGADQNNSNLKKQLSESISEAKDLQKELENLRKKLAEKKEIGWEEKEKIKDLLEKQKQLEKKISQIQQQNELNNDQQNQFKQYSEEILEKQERLEELFDELMTEEMKKMMEEMRKMMDKLDKNQLENELEQVDLTNKDLEKELDRSLELFKQLEFEQKLDEVKNKLEKLAEEENTLADVTKEKKSSTEKLKEKQDDLNKEFEDLKKELTDLEKLDKELENPNGLDKTEEDSEKISEEMQKSSDQLNSKKNKKASDTQKQAAEDMQAMAEKMEAMQSQSADEGEDMEALRQLMENLIYLSFEQEELMEKYKLLDRKNPAYIALAQRQKELKDDAKMIEDTLFALSKRVPQLASTVNREIAAINSNMSKTIHFMAERQKPMAASRQQYVMTSVNNLALLFDEALQQMQKQAQQKQGKGSCSKPGGGGKPKPGPSGSMKKMQQKLNEQMKQLKEAMKKGQKPGKKPGKKPGQKPGKSSGSGQSGMSESFAKMAAQQAKIRKALQDMKKEGNGSGKGLNALSKMMEETEADLVNKRITQQTINRQKQILTKLLESEKADRERELDDKRESKEGKIDQKGNPEMFFEYNQKKETEIELINTTPPNFNRFYKNKVTKYFQKINE